MNFVWGQTKVVWEKNDAEVLNKTKNQSKMHELCDRYSLSPSIDILYEESIHNGNFEIVTKEHEDGTLEKYTIDKSTGNKYGKYENFGKMDEKTKFRPVKQQGFYGRDGREGTWKSFIGDQLITEIEYKNGVVHGTTRQWNMSGKLILDSEYNNGNLVGETYY